MPYEQRQSRLRFTYESASGTVQLSGSRTGTLMDVYSHDRRQGHATGMMLEIVEWADKNRTTLDLMPAPYVVGSVRDFLNVSQLVEFYRKFGFEYVSGHPIFMHRFVS